MASSSSPESAENVDYKSYEYRKVEENNAENVDYKSDEYRKVEENNDEIVDYKSDEDRKVEENNDEIVDVKSDEDRKVEENNDEIVDVKSDEDRKVEENKIDFLVGNFKQSIHEIAQGKKDAFICRIPDDIRAKHNNAYEPKIITIGPYHCNIPENPKFRAMKEMKMVYLKDICRRSLDDKNGDITSILNTYVTAVHGKESEARDHYSDPIDEMSSEDFVKMLVLDGCFIVEYMLKRAMDGRVEMQMPFQMKNMPTLRWDLLLLENQIPFFILETIFQNTKHEFDTLDILLHYFHKGKEKTQMKKQLLEQQTEIHHLLHLSHFCLINQLQLPNQQNKIRNIAENRFEYLYIKFILFIKSVWKYLKWFSFFIIRLIFTVLNIFNWRCWKYFNIYSPIEGTGQRTKKFSRSIPTATQMNESGVQFKKKQINGRGYLDVSFEDGIMYIPTINIQENTFIEYRNLLALEQTSKTYGNDFTSYVVFMDNLIDTANDVTLLKKCKIIESKLGCAEDVAKFFNEIRSGLAFDFDKHRLAGMFDEINEYCNQTYNRWRAKLIHDYFSSPWSIISLLAAIILLTLAAVQTAYSIIQVKTGK